MSRRRTSIPVSSTPPPRAGVLHGRDGSRSTEIWPDHQRGWRVAGELQVWGSGPLIRWLLDHRLVDEIVLLIYPVVVGQGTRLFPSTGPDISLELVDLKTHSEGAHDPHVPGYRPSPVRSGHDLRHGSAIAESLVFGGWPRRDRSIS